MSAIPYPLDPIGTYSPYFQLIVKPGILGDSLTYGFTPYWSTGGYCKVVDWGDGASEDATTSGTLITHTYAVAGTYTIRIKADCYAVRFGAYSDYAPLIYDANGNWDALGDITNCGSMFFNCSNAIFAFADFPKNISNGASMYRDCPKVRLHFNKLPDTLTNATQMFYNCLEAQLSVTRIPETVTGLGGIFCNCIKSSIRIHKLPDAIQTFGWMFYGCRKAVIDLDELAANAPEGGWTEITDISNMFTNAGSGNSPGTVTGSRSAFLAKLPNVTNTTKAFDGTNTTE